MSDAYVDTMLGDGETVLAEGRQHWMALIRFALQPILVFIAAVVCLGIGIWLDPVGDGLFNQVVRWIDTLLGLLTAGLFILAVVWFPMQVLRWIKRRYLVTDRRVLYVEGVLRRNSRDAGLQMITDVGFRQSFLGRKLGFGDLVIATAANRPLHFEKMRDAILFKKVIMAAQQGTIQARADQILGKTGTVPSVAAVAAAIDPSSVVPTEPAWDHSDVPQIAEDDLPPADPLIFGAAAAPEAETPAETPAVVPPPAPAAAAASPAPAAKVAATPAAATGGTESVTAALTDLAALRDSGAISEADYEAKKQELLDRI